MININELVNSYLFDFGSFLKLFGWEPTSRGDSGLVYSFEDTDESFHIDPVTLDVTVRYSDGTDRSISFTELISNLITFKYEDGSPVNYADREAYLASIDASQTYISVSGTELSGYSTDSYVLNNVYHDDPNIDAISYVEDFLTEVFIDSRVPYHALPANIRPWVEDICRGSACGDAPAFMSAMPVLAFIAGANAFVHCPYISKNWTEPIVLWSAVVGESGSGKTPHINALKDWFSEANINACAIYARELAEYNRLSAEHKRTQKRAESIRGAATQAQITPAPKAPVRRVINADATTSERLWQSLAKHTAIIHCDELSEFVESNDAYKKNNSDSKYYLTAYQGGSRLVSRKSGDVLIKRNEVCFMGGLQPCALRSMAAKSNGDGFVPRFYLAEAKRKPVKSFNDEPYEFETSEYRMWKTEVSRRLGMFDGNVCGWQGMAGWGDGPQGSGLPEQQDSLVRLDLSRDAALLLHGFISQVVDKLIDETPPGDLRSFYCKQPGNLMRIAGMLHMLSQDSIALPCDRTVSADTMHNAITIIKWMMEQTRKCHEVYIDPFRQQSRSQSRSRSDYRLKTEPVDDKTFLLQLINKRINKGDDGTIKLRDLNIFSKKVRQWDSVYRRSILDELVADGEITLETGKNESVIISLAGKRDTDTDTDPEPDTTTHQKIDVEWNTQTPPDTTAAPRRKKPVFSMSKTINGT